MFAVFAAYAGLELFFVTLGLLAVVGLALVVAILDRLDREPAYTPRHASHRYQGQHRATRYQLAQSPLTGLFEVHQVA